jgi:hypothetical protein
MRSALDGNFVACPEELRVELRTAGGSTLGLLVEEIGLGRPE